MGNGDSSRLFRCQCSVRDIGDLSVRHLVLALAVGKRLNSACAEKEM